MGGLPRCSETGKVAPAQTLKGCFGLGIVWSELPGGVWRGSQVTRGSSHPSSLTSPQARERKTRAFISWTHSACYLGKPSTGGGTLPTPSPASQPATAPPTREMCHAQGAPERTPFSFPKN